MMKRNTDYIMNRMPGVMDFGNKLAYKLNESEFKNMRSRGGVAGVRREYTKNPLPQQVEQYSSYPSLQQRPVTKPQCRALQNGLYEILGNIDTAVHDIVQKTSYQDSYGGFVGSTSNKGQFDADKRILNTNALVMKQVSDRNPNLTNDLLTVARAADTAVANRLNNYASELSQLRINQHARAQTLEDLNKTRAYLVDMIAKSINTCESV
jgi:hypothetical protein